MELRQYLSIVWKWLWLIALAVVIASVTSYFASRAATRLYRTKTTLMVGRITQNPDPNSIDIYTGQQLALTYIQLVQREPVLNGAREKLGLDIPWQALLGQVTATVIPQTQLMEISVVDSDPYRAKVLADAIANELIAQSPTNPTTVGPEQAQFAQKQLVDLEDKIIAAEDEIEQLRTKLDTANSARQIQELEGQISILESKIGGWVDTYSALLLSIQGGDVNTLTVVEQAAIPTSPISPNVRMNVLTAAAIGLVLALGGAFLVEYLDDTVKTPDDITRTTGLPTLGAIARIEGESYPDKLITVKKPLAPSTEAYRIMRTNLQFSLVDKNARTLMMTSPGPGEGKSVTLANLGVVLAQSGQRVIIVDSDLRRPVQHKIFDLANRYGLSDAIIRPGQDLSDYMQNTTIENLKLLSSGPLPPNPSELLGSTRMLAILEDLKSLADVILFDSPPILIVADGAILGGILDGVVLVTDSGRTRTNLVKRAVEELRRGRANLLGVVLNRLSLGGSYYYHYYHYNYYLDDEGTRRTRGKHTRSKKKTAELSQTPTPPSE